MTNHLPVFDTEYGEAVETAPNRWRFRECTDVRTGRGASILTVFATEYIDAVGNVAMLLAEGAATFRPRAW